MDKDIVTPDNNPMGYYIGFYKHCSYCRKKLTLIEIIIIREKKNMSFYYCGKCDRMFGVVYYCKDGRIYQKVIQLDSYQLKRFKEKYPERFKNGN